MDGLQCFSYLLVIYVKERRDMEKMSCSDKEEEELLPGFRFHPTDEELVGFYLRRKVEKKPLSIELIKQIDIYKYDPWELPKFSSSGDKEWYFFCRRGRKYKNSIRPNRVTGSGFWKATGIDKPIPGVGEKSDDCIGLKKSLVYYRGSAGKGTKTDWMMHEFRLPTSSKTTNLHTDKSNQEAEIWTICRIFKRTVTYKKYSQDGSNSSAKRTSTNTCSNTSSFESDDTDTFHFFGTAAATQQIERKPLVNHTEENYPFFPGQWGSVAQPTFSALYPGIPNPHANECYRDANWDELGAIVEFAIDPALVHGCRYS